MDFDVTNSSSEADGQDVQPTEIQSESIKSKESSEPSNQVALTQECNENITEKELYEGILEELDIKQRSDKEPNQIINENSSKKDFKETAEVKTKVEKVISQDFDKIQKLVKLGLINSVQGQNLKKEVLRRAFDKLVQTEKIKRTMLPGVARNFQQNTTSDNSKNASNVIEEFSKNNPEFFTSDGRKEVLNYLKSGGVPIGKDELNKISEIIRIVEKSAIDRYLKKAAHERVLKNSNETAKQRLIANAQKSSFGKNLSRSFTREQIGRMSGAEFTKYEPAIMEALKKGLIK